MEIGFNEKQEYLKKKPPLKGSALSFSHVRSTKGVLLLSPYYHLIKNKILIKEKIGTNLNLVKVGRHFTHVMDTKGVTLLYPVPY